jgi:aminopeptidase N
MQIRTNNEGWTWSHFHRTPKMSTYLVATVVTYFDHVEYGYQADDQSDPIVLRFWFSPDNFRFTEFAYDLAPKVLNFLERYLDEKFTLPKIDFISLPEVEVMAMENWGLIIHSDASLLYDPDRSSLMDKARVSITVTHELAHQV